LSKVSILTYQPFPVGAAATNRVLSYALGFKELGFEATVLITGPSEYGAVRNREVQGTCQGVRFVYTCGTSVLSEKVHRTGSIRKQFVKLKRNALQVYGFIRALAYVAQKQHTPEVVLLYYMDAPLLFLFWRCFALFFPFKTMLDISELHYIHAPEKRFTHSYLKGYNQLLARSADIALPISRYLENYYQTFFSASRIHRVPILANLDDFDPVLPFEDGYPYLAYCGAMNESKDGVFTLIRVFGKLAQLNKQIRLLLMGSTTNTHDAKCIQELIETQKLGGRVLCTGFIPRTDMISYLKGARVLILLKPFNEQSASCFPTKLGEYLAAGRPVYTTATGEIPEYLSNGVNAFLSETWDETAMAHDLARLLSNTELLENVGNAGRLVAEQQFDYKIQMKALIRFLANLNNK